MTRIIAPHAIDTNTDHYQAVLAEMQIRGECSIRAMWSDAFDVYFAIEGSHRLAAAQELGISVEIHDIGCDECDTWVTDLDGATVARDWEWLSEYLITFSHANDAPCFEVED
jgi:hypothetical protein